MKFSAHKLQRGIIHLGVLGILFLVGALAVGAAVVNNSGFDFNISERAGGAPQTKEECEKQACEGKYKWVWVKGACKKRYQPKGCSSESNSSSNNYGCENTTGNTYICKDAETCIGCSDGKSTGGAIPDRCRDLGLICGNFCYKGGKKYKDGEKAIPSCIDSSTTHCTKCNGATGEFE